MTGTAFVRKYGTGYKAGDINWTAYCFQVPEQKLYARFMPYHGDQREIENILVSDVPNCPSARRPGVTLKPLVTGEGLRIGDPYKKVIALYGEPDVEEKADGREQIGIDYQTQLNTAPFGDKRLRYLSTQDSDSLLHAEIYLRKGLVSAILISVSE